MRDRFFHEYYEAISTSKHKRIGSRVKLPDFPYHFKPRTQFIMVLGLIILVESFNILRLKLEPTLFTHYEALIDVICLLIITLPIFFFLYLPYNSHWKKRLELEKSILANEERLRHALEATNFGLWDLYLPTGNAYLSSQLTHLLGYLENELTHNLSTWIKLVHPRDLSRMMDDWSNPQRPSPLRIEHEFRMLHKLGHWCWFEVTGQVVVVDENNKPVRLTGTLADITARKQNEHRIHFLSRELMNITEKERARLALDLHDDIGQLLTRMQLGLATTRKSLTTNAHSCQNCLGDLSSLVTQMGQHIHRITSELRPTVLDDIGLESAITFFINQVRPEVELEIVEQLETGGKRFDPWIETALFRITQEAVNNAIKHARAHSLRLGLWIETDQLILSIADDGVGFDPSSPSMLQNTGIGLLGMRERVAALGGEFSVEAQPGAGTQLIATVPLHGATDQIGPSDE